jgi:hypothetical protein
MLLPLALLLLATAPAAAATPESAPPADEHSLTTKVDASLYGFVELDVVGDSTQSFNERAGNVLVARPGTYAGEHERLMLSARHTRLGIKLDGPATERVKTSATVEMDFFGNQPPSPPLTEASFFQSPTLRLRHGWFKVETPVVDVLAGQTWSLFAWGNTFQPNTVEIQGVPGEVYVRSPQLRLSRKLLGDPVELELALAASRPPQRDAAVPDGQGGIKLSVGSWKGVHTPGATTTKTDPLTLGLSAVVRGFGVPTFTAQPVNEVRKTGWGVSLDGLLPIIPGTAEQRGNTLTLNASFVTGTGIVDLYQDLTGGVTFPSLPNPMMLSPAPTYPADIDNGLVFFDAAGALRTVDWRSLLLGLQYYLPPSGALWISGNASWMSSGNIADSGTASQLVKRTLWADLNLFGRLGEAVRVGAEYAWFRQTYADGVKAVNHRVQVSFFYVF